MRIEVRREFRSEHLAETAGRLVDFHKGHRGQRETAFPFVFSVTRVGACYGDCYLDGDCPPARLFVIVLFIPTATVKIFI